MRKKWPIILILFWIAVPRHVSADTIDCQVTSYFSPKRQAVLAITQELSTAKRRARLALYGLNNPQIVDEIIKAHSRGVSIAIKLDRTQSGVKGQKLAIERLRHARVPTFVSGVSALMHHKFAVFDDRRVITGSYNFTTSAESRNRENFVILDCAEIAERFEREWKWIE